MTTFPGSPQLTNSRCRTGQSAGKRGRVPTYAGDNDPSAGGAGYECEGVDGRSGQDIGVHPRRLTAVDED